MMDWLSSNLSSNDELESSNSSLIPALPDHIAFFCLARVPRKYHPVLKCVSKRWRGLVCSEEWREYRRKNNLSETWIYALCRDKISDQLWCYVLDPSSGRQSCWKPIPGLPPPCVKRKGVRFATVGHKLYLLGGCGWSQDATDEVYCYDVSANVWSKAASMPSARCYFGCEVLDGKIYAIGGLGLKSTVSRSWDIYDPCTNTWESHSDPDIIHQMGDVTSSVMMDGNIYILSRAPVGPPQVYMVVSDSPGSGRLQQPDAGWALGWWGPSVIVNGSLYELDQSYGTKLKIWHKDTREWSDICRLSSLLTRPPCRMVAIGKNIFIIGEGLSTVILDVNDISNANGVISSSSMPVFDSDTQVISCKCVSI